MSTPLQFVPDTQGISGSSSPDVLKRTPAPRSYTIWHPRIAEIMADSWRFNAPWCEYCDGAPDECGCYIPMKVDQRVSWSASRWDEWIKETGHQKKAKELSDSHAGTYSTLALCESISRALELFEQPVKPRLARFFDALSEWSSYEQWWLIGGGHENAGVVTIKRQTSSLTVRFLVGKDNLFLFVGGDEPQFHAISSRHAPHRLSGIVFSITRGSIADSVTILKQFFDRAEYTLPPADRPRY
jgi:hypothetical protein